MHLISVDEKSGIQAKERKLICPVQEGKSRRVESEYKRHGTTCLMAALNVLSGKLTHYLMQLTRKEKDFAVFIKQLCSKVSRTDRIIILLDQLNTHKSESLVRYVANEINFLGDLGTKGYKGILKNQKTRMTFLEDESHRIRFVFTPKHCSWLNPIENWFGKLQRQRLNNASFKSIEEFENKIRAYIEFANKCMAKPYKWQFKGFTKNKNFICNVN